MVCQNDTIRQTPLILTLNLTIMKGNSASLLLIIITVVLSTIVGCIGYGSHFSRSYVTGYVIYEGISVRRAISSTSSKHLDISGKVSHRISLLSKGADKDLYNSICEEFGDTAYNQFVWEPLSTECKYPHFATINVTSNMDFDENHPRGTSLNDIMTIIYHTATDFIEEGYNDYTLLNKREKPLNELEPNDLALNWTNTFLAFTKDPDILTTHTLTFTCTNAKGETFTATYDYDFTLPEGKYEPEISSTTIYQNSGTATENVRDL